MQKLYLHVRMLLNILGPGFLIYKVQEIYPSDRIQERTTNQVGKASSLALTTVDDNQFILPFFTFVFFLLFPYITAFLLLCIKIAPYTFSLSNIIYYVLGNNLISMSLFSILRTDLGAGPHEQHGQACRMFITLALLPTPLSDPFC